MTSIELGGWTEAQDATEETQKICDQVKHQVEEKTGKNYVSFNLPTFFKTSTHTTHLNAFTSYFIYTGEGPSGKHYIHLMVSQSLRNGKEEIELLGQQENRTKDDILV
uniref:Cystatin domain-containing protein n=1 Tax=Sander lucioperca TaxID=283035 RepID=A0A8D0D2Z5_SANLU